MERLKQLRAAAEAWFGQLSARERTLVSLAGAAVAVFTVFLVATGVSHGISAREARIGDKTRIMAQIGKLATGYRAAQAERQAMEARLKGQQVPLMSHIAQTGATLGVDVNDLRPTGVPSETNGLVEESVEVNLARIDLGKLGRLVQALEHGAGVVKVRRLRITTRQDDPLLVDASIVVASFTLKS
jgi:general secretion pathway protein M